MDKNKKILLGILLAIIIIAIIVMCIVSGPKTKDEKDNENTINETENISKEEFVQILEDGTKLNISSKLNETKTVNGIEISNIQFTYKDGLTVLIADVTNNSGKDLKDVTEANITLLDENDGEIITVEALISPTKVGETTQLNTSMTLDYVNAYDFKVTLK